MTPEILADLFLRFLSSCNFTEAEVYELIGRFSSGAVTIHTGATTSIPNPTRQPLSKSTAPTEEILDPGNVIINKGQQCECGLCNKLVYSVTEDVFENTKKKVFIAAFSPANGAPPLPMPLDVWTDPYGNMAIDCPLCKGTKTVWIKGKGDKLFSDYPTGGQPLNSK